LAVVLALVLWTPLRDWLGIAQANGGRTDIAAVDGCIEAAGPLREDLQDDLTDPSALQQRYDEWRAATVAVLQSGYRGDFTSPDRSDLQRFVGQRASDSHQAHLLVQLDWDLHKLRRIKCDMRRELV
jgi:hypothetical protein